MVFDLVGEIVEQKGLLECKNLEDLIGKFTNITSFNYLKPMFEKEISPKINKIKEEKKYVVLKILSEVPFNSQEEDIKSALDILLNDYIACELEAKYDCLDTRIFDLEHTIEGKNERGNEFSVEIPLFAHAKFGETRWRFDTTVRESYNDYKIDIISKAPPIPKEIKEKAKSFSKSYMNSIFKTFEDSIMGDLLLRNYSQINPPNFIMYWIPSPSELKINVEVINKDPVLVANNLGRCFFIGNWYVEGEKTYEHYLEEFKKSKRN